jgi:hypothetical protein
MFKRPVPRYSHQVHQISSDLEHYAPDPQVQQTESCKILEVYDLDRMEQEGCPSVVRSKILNNPGLLFAKVLLSDNNTIKYLPFAEPEDSIYLNYGNSVLIEGRRGIIRFRRNDADSGEIVIGRSVDKPMLANSSLSETYDIIGML